MKEKNQTFYSIGQVAAMVGVRQPTLRFWQRIYPALFQDVIRTPGGQRRFTQRHVDIIREINRLRELEGYTNAGAYQVLIDRHNKENTDAASQ